MSRDSWFETCRPVSRSANTHRILLTRTARTCQGSERATTGGKVGLELFLPTPCLRFRQCQTLPKI
jgi:hypothetical protein